MPARTAGRERHELIRRLHILRVGGAVGLATLSIFVYLIDGDLPIAVAAVVAGLLSLSGVSWIGKPGETQLAVSLVVDVVILAVWAWLMGGLELGLGVVFLWVLIAASLGLPPPAVLRSVMMTVAAVLTLGVLHVFFHVVDYNPDRVILVNLLIAVATMVPFGLMLRSVGLAQRESELLGVKSRLRLAELKEMREEFLSTVSFEMRTPLTSVKGFTTTLLENWEELADEDRLRFLQIVNRQADKLTRLIQTMIDFAQLDSGTLRLVSEKVNVADVLGQVRAQALRGHEDMELLIECERNLWLQGDTERVRDMVADMVGNADAHGAGPVRIKAWCEGNTTQIQISDDGPGVAPDRVPWLFERRGGALKGMTETKGIGLSLPLARELATAMKGTVEYLPGLGASFVIALPSAEPPPSRVESATLPLRLVSDFPLDSDPEEDEVDDYAAVPSELGRRSFR